MIQLPGGYYLGADNHAITLNTKRGEKRYEICGYYTTLSEALNGWRRKISRDIIGREELQEMRDVLSELRQLDEEARRMIKQVDLSGGVAGLGAGTPRKTAPEPDAAPLEVPEGDCTYTSIDRLQKPLAGKCADEDERRGVNARCA